VLVRELANRLGEKAERVAKERKRILDTSDGDRDMM
jgi:hypothetical protein